MPKSTEKGLDDIEGKYTSTSFYTQSGSLQSLDLIESLTRAVDLPVRL